MAIPLRADYVAEQLRCAAEASKDAPQAPRVLPRDRLIQGLRASNQGSATWAGLAPFRAAKPWMTTSSFWLA